GHRLKVDVEPHETSKKLRRSAAIKVLVEVVARRVLLVPATAAEPEVLFLRQLFPGRELRGRGRRTRAKARGAHRRRQAGGDPQKTAPPDADGGEAGGQKIQLAVGDMRNSHERVSLLFQFGVQRVPDAVTEERERQHGN